jgi:hypothetical protein
MGTTVHIIETYVPGLKERPLSWCERLLAEIATVLRADGAHIAGLAIPKDETVMWLVWGHPDRVDPEPAVVASILRQTSSAGGGVEVERVVDGLVIWSQSDSGPTF